MPSRVKYNHKYGRKLLVELNNGRQYRGTFIKTDTYRITLYRMQEVGREFVMPGEQHYFKNEFFSIQRDVGNPDDVSDSEPEVEEEEKEELDDWEELQKGCKYIEFVDSRAFKYIETIQGYDTVAVRALGSEKGRDNPISFVFIATKHEVYVFDIKALGEEFLMEHLKTIFECVDLLKIVHNSMTLVDCLYNSYHIVLKNFFDLQINDLAITKALTPRNLCDVYMEYLNLPIEFAGTSDDYDPDMVNRRPLNRDLLEFAVRATTYMFPLKNVMERKLLETFNKTNKYYLNRTRSRSPIAALMIKSVDVFEELEKMDEFKPN